MAIDPSILEKYGGAPAAPKSSGSIASVVGKYADFLPSDERETGSAPAASGPAPASMGTVQDAPVSSEEGDNPAGPQYDRATLPFPRGDPRNNDPKWNPGIGGGNRTVSDTLDKPLLNIPEISPRVAAFLSNPASLGPIMGNPLGEAVINTTIKTANSLSSPKNLAITAALGELGAIAKTGGALGELAKAAFATASAKFAVEGAKATGEGWANFLNVADDPDHTPKQLIQAGVDILPQAAMTVGGLHGVKVADNLGAAAPAMAQATEAPPEAPAAPPAMPEPVKAPSIITKIESVEGNKQSPAQTNVQVNDALITPPEAPAPQPAAPAAPAMPEVDYAAEQNRLNTGVPGYESRKTQGEPHSAREIADMDAEKFRQYLKDAQNVLDGQGGSGANALTAEAHRLGEELADSKNGVAELEAHYSDSKDAVAEGIAKAKSVPDQAGQMEALKEVNVLAAKSQFFGEAIAAAKNEGSYLERNKPTNEPVPPSVPIREAAQDQTAPNPDNGAKGAGAPPVGDGQAADIARAQEFLRQSRSARNVKPKSNELPVVSESVQSPAESLQAKDLAQPAGAADTGAAGEAGPVVRRPRAVESGPAAADAAGRPRALPGVRSTARESKIAAAVSREAAARAGAASRAARPESTRISANLPEPAATAPASPVPEPGDVRPVLRSGAKGNPNPDTGAPGNEPVLATESELRAAADSQRGKPESAMLRVVQKLQNEGISGMFTHLLEHVGDLAHRLQEPGGIGLSGAAEKIRMLDRLVNPERGNMGLREEADNAFHAGAEYNIMKEHPELDTTIPRRVGWDELRSKYGADIVAEEARLRAFAQRTLREYVAAHESDNLPVTKAGQMGKDAAIALGNMDYGKLGSISDRLRTFFDKNKDSNAIFERSNPTPKPNAVQIKAAGEIPVQSEASPSPQVGRANPVVQEPAGRGAVEPPAQAPNRQASPAEVPPAKLGVQSPASAAEGAEYAAAKARMDGLAAEPPKPPTEVPRKAPPAPEEPDPEAMAKTLKNNVKKALDSPSVDVAAKASIRKAIDETTENNALKLKDLPPNVVQSLLDHVEEQTVLGKQAFKTRAETHAAEVGNKLEMMGEERATSHPINTRPMEVSPGERLSVFQRIKQVAGNKWDAMMNNAVQGGVYLNVRDMVLDTLDGYKNHKGFLSRYLGGDIDRGFNAALTLSDQMRKPIEEVLKTHKLDEASLERVTMYAIARQGKAARVLESGAKPEVLYDMQSPTGPHELMKLTPAEQAFYDAARKVLDEAGGKVKDLMRQQYNVDVKMVKDYWPIQRDYNLYQKPVATPELKTGSGETVAQDTFGGAFKNLFDDFLPIKTTKTKQGFTIDRMQGAKGPVKLNAAEGLEQHIRQVSHLLANQDMLKTWGEIARKPEFKEQYGNVGQKYITDLLDTVARNSSPAGTHGWPMVDAAMKNLSAAVLGLRLLSQGKHVTNIFSAIKEIPTDHLMSGFIERTKPETQAWLKQNRPEILNRFGGEQSIMEIAGRQSPLHKLNTLAKAQKATFGIERGIDAALAEASWIGAYKANLQKLGYDPAAYRDIPLNSSAAQMADVTARKVVTSPALKDVSQVLSRNKFTANNATLRRALFQFQSTMLRQASQFGHELVSAKVNGDAGGAAATIMTAMAIVAGEVYITHLNRQFKHAVFGGPEAKDVPIPAEVARDMLRRVPVVGPVLAATQDNDTGIPIVSTTLQGITAAKHLYSGKDQYNKPLSGLQTSKDAIDLGTTLASLGGLPAATSIGEYLKATLPRQQKY